MKRTARRQLPAIGHLLALESAARLGSITLASQELALTQSAVSKQISELEDYVGVRLAERSPSGFAATAAGKAYLAKVAPLLAQLEQATIELMTARQAQGTLHLSVPPSLAQLWLLPRLPEFQRLHPGITVDITTSGGFPADMDDPDLDGAIVFSRAVDRAYVGEVVLRPVYLPVCAPALAPAQVPAAPEWFAKAPLVHLSGSTQAWPSFLAQLKVQRPNVMEGPRYSLLTLSLQAALGGLGCALLPDYVTREALAEGRLVRLSDAAYQPAESYFFICRPERADAPPVAAFRAWVRQVGLR